MVEALAASPAFGLPDGIGHQGLELRERSDVALASVTARRGRGPDLDARVAEVFGLALPATPLRRASGTVAFAWVGPGHWLAACDGEPGHRFERRLRVALAGLASISDQSDARGIIRISGPNARNVLAKGLPIDTDPQAMHAGCSVVSAIGHIGVHLWQLDDAPTYECVVSRSTAGSFLQWLEAAASAG